MLGRALGVAAHHSLPAVISVAAKVAFAAAVENASAMRRTASSAAWAAAGKGGSKPGNDSAGTTRPCPYPSPYPSLHGKTLVSIEDCLEAGEAATAASAQPPVPPTPAAPVRAGNAGLVFVDGSWYHKGGRNGRTEYESGPRIPNSVYVDMDDIAAKGPIYNPKNLPHMIPPKHLFEAAMDAFGIINDDHIVVYGKRGCIFTPRTYFLFRSMGHDPLRIHLMQGSFEEWVENGGPIETGRKAVMKTDDLNLSESAPSRTYRARDATNICKLDQVLRAVNVGGRVNGGDGGEKGRDDGHNDDDDCSTIILDPRGPASYEAGHIPGSINVPYLSLVQENDWLKFRPREELRDVFRNAGVPLDVLNNSSNNNNNNNNREKRIICTCGSGVSVCHLFVALEECGWDSGGGKMVIYDGSWAEWGSEKGTPKAFGGGG